MISIHEFVIRARVEQQAVETWIAAGWLVPPQTAPEPMFSDVDLARAQLIRDLREDLGVNDEGSRSSCICSTRCTACAGACRAARRDAGRTDKPTMRVTRWREASWPTVIDRHRPCAVTAP
jgi:hypothetical protein